MKVSKETKVLAILLALFLLIGIGCGAAVAMSAPLIVVDGVTITSAGDIPSSDIERIDVLKDAAATAIYGSKAANGGLISNEVNPDDIASIQVLKDASSTAIYGSRGAN